MAKISLRGYNHEIENMIERGHTEEAIAHCKFILKAYPKHLNTYRLLGKAFLESQRYSEAADILQRILSVIPDDFVAQIGMSIIREDEGNLDAAIYHMERAFEIQPSNAAIQDELRRLYGRRDGIEPPKLRLTRGALVRMYARGELYRQAIAEARSAIVEDPQRLDLEIVLAKMYYQTGQKPEAAEICSRLVSKLPFCLEANRILADVLPETSRAEDAKIYQQRLLSLDPYLGYLTEAIQDPQQIPENAISVDHLEWTPSLETEQQPAWANSLGIQLESHPAEQAPSWLAETSVNPPSETSSEASSITPFTEEPGLVGDLETRGDSSLAEEPAEGSNLPEWMGSLGWSISGKPAEEQPQEPAFEESVNEATPADIPEWLKNMAPATETEPSPSGEQENLEWLTSILPADQNAATAQEQPVVPSTPETPPVEGEAIPAFSDELPEWLNTGTTNTEETVYPDQSQEPLPDWLTETPELHNIPAAEDLAAMKQTEETAPAQSQLPDLQDQFTETESAIAGEGIADQILSTPPTDIANQPTSPNLDNMDDAMAWLESLAAKQGADEETLITRPEERLETPPEWVAQSIQSEEVKPAEEILEPAPAEEPIQPVSVIPEIVQPPSTETVIAGEEAELLLESEAQKIEMAFGEEVPFIEATITEELTPEASVETMEEVTPVEAVKGEEPSPGIKVEAVEQIFQSEELPTEAVPVEEIPTPAVEIPEEAATPESSLVSEAPSDMDAAFAWLESLAAKQGAEADSLIVAAEDRQETPPEWVIQQSQQLETPAPEAPVTEPTEEMSEWIKSGEEQPLTPDSVMPVEAISESLEWFNKAEPSIEASPIAPETEGLDLAGVSTEGPESPVQEAPSIPTEPDWIQGLEDTSQPAEMPTSEVVTALPTEELPPSPEAETPSTEPKPGQTRPLPSLFAGLVTHPSEENLGELAEQKEEVSLPDWLKEENQPALEVKPAEGELVPEEIQPQEKTSVTEPSASAEQPEIETPFETPEAPALPDWLKNLETEQEEPLPVEPILEFPAESQPEIQSVSNIPAEMVVQAQSSLGKGQIDFALSLYDRLIEQGQHLDETIHDLRDALYRFPVESSIWQTLGDAYMRNNRLQDALDAYTKAEELLK